MEEYTDIDNAKNAVPHTYESINPSYIHDTTDHAENVRSTPPKPARPVVKPVSRRAWLLGLLPTLLILAAVCVVVVVLFVQLAAIRNMTRDLAVRVESLKADSSPYPEDRAPDFPMATLQNLTIEVSSLQELRIQMASLQNLSSQVASLQELRTRVTHLQNLMEQDDCTDDRCANGGTCVEGVNSTTCLCLRGYAGNVCEIALVELSRPARGTTCSVSSIEDRYGNWECGNAIDGVIAPVPGAEWASNVTDVSWYILEFSSTYTLYKLELYARCSNEKQCSGYQLSFSGGSTQAITRPCNGNNEWRECTTTPMDDFDLLPVTTSFLKLQCTVTCPTAPYHLGLREILVWGTV